MKTTEYIKKFDLKNGLTLENRKLFLQDFYFDFLANIEVDIENSSEFSEDNFLNIVSSFRTKFTSIFNKCPMEYPEEIWDEFYENYIPEVLFRTFPDIKEECSDIKKMSFEQLYRYVFDILELGKLKLSRGYLTNPTENTLVDIINSCKKILDINLYYIECFSTQCLLDWSTNKLKFVLRQNKKILDENRRKWQEENEKRKKERQRWNEYFNEFLKRQIIDLSCFTSLGIEPTKDESIIKTAYKKLSLKYHPDIVGLTKENHEKQVELNLAKQKCISYCKQ